MSTNSLIDKFLAPEPVEAAPDVATIEQLLRHFVAPGAVAEMRALGVVRGHRRGAMSGYYDTDHLDLMAQDALEITPHAEGVYFTFNPLNPALLARRANRFDWAESGGSASDRDVLRRRWLLVDIDPVRPAKVSATDIEKARAMGVALAVRDDLRSLGWPDPVVADSGNGINLLFRIDLPTDDDGRLRRMLRRLAFLFDSDEVKIDQAVSNPARLCKVFGTLARKGDSLPDRPHRPSRILEVPTKLEVVPVQLLEQLAAEAQPEKTTTVARPAATTTGVN